MMSVTLQDVADAAGVSVSVASRSLNGRAREYRISVETEKAVKKTAAKLGFRPSQVARSLRLKRSGLVGVVVPDLSNPFFASIAREVTLAAEHDGYSVIVADSRETTANEEKLIEQLLGRQIEALVVCPVGRQHDHLAAIDASGLPVVLVDRGFAKSKLVQVTSDHRCGAQRATELLLDHGHRSIGVLQGLPGTLPNDQRIEGLRAGLAKHDIELDSSMVAGDSFSEHSGYESARQLLSTHPNITAFFAFSTPNALGALRAVSEMGLRVPEDLSIVTFDDIPFADFMSVPLTTVAQDVPALGRTAAELISKQLRTGKRPRTKKHSIEVHLVNRDSIREAKQ
ncbi:LacI family DNA-binding transcriptional regulator [Novipirellula rosea]